MWLTAISQVIARLTHSNASVQKTLALILTKVMIEYPQHSLWATAYAYNVVILFSRQNMQSLFYSNLYFAVELQRIKRPLSRNYEEQPNCANRGLG